MRTDLVSMILVPMLFASCATAIACDKHYHAADIGSISCSKLPGASLCTEAEKAKYRSLGSGKTREGRAYRRKIMKEIESGKRRKK